MAYEHNVLWVPHDWNTAVGLAADIQIACDMPVAKYVEFLTPSPDVDDLIRTPFKLDADGLLTLPERPSLGIELNPETKERFGT